MNSIHFILLTLAISVSYSGVANATATKSELSTCYQKSGTLEKVDCYDKLAVKYGAAPTLSTNSSGDIGKWSITNEVNPIDDSKTYVAVLKEEKAARGPLGNQMSLVLRCKEDTTEVYINWGEYLGDDGTSVYSDYKNVIERIGADAARTRKWSISTNNTSTFAPTGTDIDLVTALDKSNKYIVQTTPYGENPMTGIFELQGINSVATSLAETCNWKEILEASRG